MKPGQMVGKLALVALTVLFGSQAWAQEAEGPTGGMSLQDCIDYSLENSPEVKNARLDVKSAEYKIKETTGIGLPQIGLEGQGMRNIDVQKQFLPANAFDDSAPDNVVVPLGFGVDWSSQMALNVNQIIFDGSYLVGLQASKTYKELFERSEKQTKIDKAEAVSNAYYAVLVGETRLELLKQNVIRVDSILVNTKKMYDNGFAELLDVQRLTISRNNLSVEIGRVEDFTRLNKRLLKFQMGMDLEDEITLSENLESFVSSIEPMNDVALNPEKRIEYQILETQRRLNELNVKNVKMSYMPKLYGFYTNGFNNGALGFGDLMRFGDWQNYSYLGVSLQVPLFSGLQGRNQVKQGQIDIQKNENDMAMFRQSVALEADRAQRDYNNNMLAMKKAQENKALAEEVLRTTTVKYENGVGSNIEVIEAETALKESETQLLIAVYDALVAKTALEKATGQLLD